MMSGNGRHTAVGDAAILWVRADADVGRECESRQERPMRGTRAGTIAVGALAAAGVLAVLAATRSWRRATAVAVDGLTAGADGASRAAAAGGDLPAPVARYLELGLGLGASRGASPRLRTAEVHWAGEFRLRPDGEWRPFTAEQHFTAQPPGFVWDAAIHMLPLVGGVVPMRVRDAYLGGRGSMLGRFGGVVPVVDEAGTPEMASSALTRWLGEAAWFPAALLPGGPVTWEAIDDTTARATVVDGAVRASAEFHFAPTGELVRMTALRYRDVDGTPVLTRFEGRYGAYARLGGVLVPREAEVAWLLPAGRFGYWRGRPTAVAYAYAHAHAASGDGDGRPRR
jgi:hypothetical protein